MTYATNGQESGVFKSVNALGKALGVGVAILVTPAVYTHTREPLYTYLSDAWGRQAGLWLTWAMAGVDAFALYTATTLGFTALVVWIMTVIAARRFPND